MIHWLEVLLDALALQLGSLACRTFDPPGKERLRSGCLEHGSALHRKTSILEVVER